METLFENNHIIVINKPANLLSVPGRGAEKQDSVETRIRAICPGAAAVHRLDMATSGIIIIAKHKDAERHYKRCFENRQTDKTYHAICHGSIEPDTGKIEYPLRCDWERRPRQMVCYEHGKPAQTLYRVLDREKNTTRVELTPITGRSHQLRVHLAEIGHPIIGDNLYAYPEDHDYPRLLLHATRLNVPAMEGETHHFFSPVPF